jgi:seryl-tRNA synthetase
MDPKFISDNYDLVIENEKKRNGSIDTVNQIMALYLELVRCDFMVSQLKRIKNLSGSLMKNKENPDSLDFNQDFWDTFKNNLYERSTMTIAINSLEKLKPSAIKELLKEVKRETSETESILKDTQNLIDRKSQTLGNFVPNKIHKFIPNTSYQTTEENPDIFAPGSPLYGHYVIEPNVKFSMVWTDNDDHTERTLYTSETPGHLFNLGSQALPLKGHHQLTIDLGLVLYDKPCEMSGSRAYAFVDYGVKLNRALINYALDFIDQKGYKMIETPHMMKYSALHKVAQLSDFKDSLYSVGDSDPSITNDINATNENKYLIATSEQPITALYMDQLVKSKELPIRHAGLSHCYRKEAGSHGADTLGIFRVHQFEKVEQFVVCEPERSWDEMSRMIKIASEFYDTLGLKYRIINVASNDINNACALKYDLEGYFPHSKKYRELVSCSNCTDYLTKKVHCKTDQQKYPHFLNSTLCANTRVLCCILETYQNPLNGNVDIPNVLIPYMNGITKLTPSLIR